eukprot:scaffold1758_cov333-Pavlova_lutheri.AAC.22
MGLVEAELCQRSWLVFAWERSGNYVSTDSARNSLSNCTCTSLKTESEGRLHGIKALGYSPVLHMLA